ncbi:PQQ-dependent dehydrogenase, methanol/ethanol family [Gilvimarinus sp. F26214L]|uniref:PQQ-dependent dehydrogenase, methanol/ethanol family n=1 Tax=Gilvimarinus sp. DZF01 TaxID=3461371 RepID=UPI004046713C
MKSALPLAALAMALSVAGCTQNTATPPPTPYGAAVDDRRLLNADAEPGSWMSHGRSYDEQRYSPLDQLDASTVGQLGLAWSADMTTSRGQEATPVVVDGALYVTTAWSHVKAYDVATGNLLWEFDPGVDPAKGVDACCDVVNRGVAVWKGKVYFGTLDGRLIALDSQTGELVWEKMTVDTTKPYTITGAPRIIRDKVIIGNGGAELGVRGYVSAYDAETGEMAWRFYTIPGNPADGFEQPELEKAAETWNGEWWTEGGGGTVWDSMAYDPELDLLYIGVGNGSPWNQRYRSPGGGDNLFLSSIVALDPDDGSYQWHYQTTPGETWDYTATQHIIVADLEIDGRERRVIMQAPKNGFFYVLDAKTGELISAEPFAPVNWATHVDMETGRPVEVREARFDKTGKPFIVQPGPLGAHNWHPMAFNPDTGLVYIPVWEQVAGYATDEEFAPSDRGWNTGTDFAAGARMLAASRSSVPEAKAYLLAWDPVAQKEVWRAPQPTPRSVAGVLTTAGNLVFQGDAGGFFNAYDATTGEKLWSFKTQATVVASPSTFLVDGEQQVAILVGGRGLPKSGPGASVATTQASTNNSRLLVFKPGGTAALPESLNDTETVVAEEETREVPAVFGDYEFVTQGEQVYGRFCSVCHGPAATSPDTGTFPDLRFSQRLGSRDAWHSVVIGGELTSGGMVSFKEQITAEDAEAIRAFVVREANRDQ